MQKCPNGGKRFDIKYYQKLDEIKFIFNHISQVQKMDIFKKEDVEDFNKLQYEDSLSNNSSDK